MAFPQPFLDALIDRNPIDEVVGQYVSLTRRGSNLFGLGPFHSEKTASFSVAPDKGIYYCFGCHAGGGVVNFIMQIEGLDFPDAVRFLAKRAGMEVPEDEAYHSQYQKQERLWALCKDAARFFRQGAGGDGLEAGAGGADRGACFPPWASPRRRTYRSGRSAWTPSSASASASARTRGRRSRTP